MPWKGVTVSEQRQRFLEDYQLNYYSISELAKRFSISRKTAHKWINQFKQHGQAGFHEHSRRPHSCPWQMSSRLLGILLILSMVDRIFNVRYYQTYVSISLTYDRPFLTIMTP